MSAWINTSEARPERGQTVDWITPNGIQVNGGTFVGGLIWYPPGSEMYVYYTPEKWRAAEKS